MGVDAAVSGRVLEATVVELLPRLTWTVELDGGVRVLAHAAGVGARNFVRLRAGDRVAVELSAHDPTRGRIVRLLKGKGGPEGAPVK